MKLRYALDIPPEPRDSEQAWINIDYFETKEEAIKVAKELFGADDEGRIGLVTELPLDWCADYEV